MLVVEKSDQSRFRRLQPAVKQTYRSGFDQGENSRPDRSQTARAKSTIFNMLSGPRFPARTAGLDQVRGVTSLSGHGRRTRSSIAASAAPSRFPAGPFRRLSIFENVALARLLRETQNPATAEAKAFDSGRARPLAIVGLPRPTRKVMVGRAWGAAGLKKLELRQKAALPPGRSSCWPTRAWAALDEAEMGPGKPTLFAPRFAGRASASPSIWVEHIMGGADARRRSTASWCWIHGEKISEGLPSQVAKRSARH